MKKSLLFLSTLSFVFLAAPGLHAQPEGEAQRREADMYFRLNDFSQANMLYQAALEKVTDNYDMLLNVAECYRFLNVPESALLWYGKAAAAKPLPDIFLLQKAHMHTRIGQYEAAITVLETYQKMGGKAETAQHYIAYNRYALAERAKTSPYKLQLEYASTESADFGPSYYKGQVVFSSARSDIQRPTQTGSTRFGKDRNHLFISGLDNNGYLTRPQFFLNELADNASINYGPVSFSGDGRRAAYSHNQYLNASAQVLFSPNLPSSNFYLADVSEQRQFVDAQPFPHGGTAISNIFPHLAGDGSTVYFASDREGGFGGFDIYRSVLTEQGWSAPQNLGPQVNTPGHEVSPYFANNSLYFASDYHLGFGGMDVLVAQIGAQGQWRVSNLGPHVNSSYDDYGFIFNPAEGSGYVVSNRPGGKGLEDLYRVRYAAQPFQVVVTDAATQKPLPNAYVDFSDCFDMVLSTDAKGEAKTSFLTPQICQMLLRCEGYAPQSFEVSADTPSPLRVALVKEADLFGGTVLDRQTNQFLPDVRVEAINVVTGQSVAANSDAQGRFKLPLEKYKRYRVRFSARGYTEVSQFFDTGDGSKKDIFGTFAMIPTETAQVADLNSKPATGTSAEAPGSMVGRSGHAVQIVSLGEGMRIEGLEKLLSLGTLYTDRSNPPYVRYRLGLYDTKAQCDAVRDQVRALGFPDAFSLAVSIADDKEYQPYNKLEPKTYEDAQSGTTPKGAAELPTGSAVELPYRVQLGAYRNVALFRAERVADIGNIAQERRDNGLTVVYLQGYATPEAAKAAQSEARARGFADAFVVKTP